MKNLLVQKKGFPRAKKIKIVQLRVKSSPPVSCCFGMRCRRIPDVLHIYGTYPATLYRHDDSLSRRAGVVLLNS